MVVPGSIPNIIFSVLKLKFHIFEVTTKLINLRVLIIKVVLILYTALIALLCVGFLRLAPKVRRLQKHFLGPFTTRFSIVIPFRNEAENLELLLVSLSQLDYPKELFEVILVNDDSTDASVEIINSLSAKMNLKLRILENERFSGSPKKDALTKAITHANFEWIATTDADCKLPANWLKHFHTEITANHADFIAAPVIFFDGKGFLNAFQKLDFLSLQGATMGSFGIQKPFMCNGANLAFKKSTFEEVGGYAMTNHLASGDDVFLMHKFLKTDKKVVYHNASQATVETAAQTSWKALIQQRVRWAAKASAYKNPEALLIGLLVFFGNLACITVLFFPEIYILLLPKIIIDFVLIALTANLLKQQKALLYFIPTAVFYPFFTVWVAVRSQLGSFVWKDRMFRK